MFIPDPDFYPSRITDSRTAPKEEGEKLFGYTIFCSHKKHKIVNNFEQVKNIVLTKTLRIIVLFTQKFVIKLSKIWVWARDPGSKRHRIPDPQHWQRLK
jgi:hypothetical protein